MSLRVRMDDGGTNAGHRTITEKRLNPWTCTHGHQNKPNHLRCMTTGCNEKRC